MIEPKLRKENFDHQDNNSEDEALHSELNVFTSAGDMADSSFSRKLLANFAAKLSEKSAGNNSVGQSESEKYNRKES